MKLHFSRNILDFQYNTNYYVILQKYFSCDLNEIAENSIRFHRHCFNMSHDAHYKSALLFQTFICPDYGFSLFLYKTHIRPSMEINIQICSLHRF